MASCYSEDLWKRDIAKRFKDILNRKAKILEIGSAIANQKGFFHVGKYLGLDVAEAVGVDIVSIAHKYKGKPNSFDAVCSFSALEHDMYWRETLKKMVELTRRGGLVFFSCCFNWEEHGTLGTSPEQSLTNKISKEWGNYYRNVTPNDIRTVWDLEQVFTGYSLGISRFHDGFTVFWGMKR